MELFKTWSYKDKKIFVRPGLNDITYMPELIPSLRRKFRRNFQVFRLGIGLSVH